MVTAMLAHVTISSLTQYSLAGLLGLAAGLSITILNNPSTRNDELDEDNG